MARRYVRDFHGFGMTEYITYWIMQTVAMMLTAVLIPGLKITSIFGALGTVVCLAFVNSTIWDAALFFNVPSTFTMHTLTLLLSNGLLFWVLVKVLPGIEVRGIVPALFAPLVFTVLSMLVDKYGKTVDWPSLIDSGLSSIKQWRTILKQGQPL